MNEINLNQLNNSIEKLAQYVVNHVATKEDLKQKADKNDVNTIKNDVKELKFDVYTIKDNVSELKSDVEKMKETQQTIVNGLDAQAGQLDIIRTEQRATSAAMGRIEERLVEHAFYEKKIDFKQEIS